MKKSAINLRSIGYNLTILAREDLLAHYMDGIEKFLAEKMEEHKDVHWDVHAALMRHDLKARYKNFLAYSQLRIKGNKDWDDFIAESIWYFFTWAYIYETPINLVDIAAFDKVITRGLYVNMTDGDKPDLVEGVDYIKYVKVGGREYHSYVSTQ
jgi:hypothetical protein